MRQKYRNEYKVKKRKKFLLQLLAVFFIMVIAVAGLVYFLFFSKIFDIRLISISGSETVGQADLESAVNNWLGVKKLGIARKNNFLFVSSKNLAAYITAQFPKLDSVSVVKKPVHGLAISVSERKSDGIWCLMKQGSCFYFDKNAIAYANAAGSSGFLITNISDYRDREKITLGSPVVSSDWFQNISTAKGLLPKADLFISNFSIPADSFDEFDAQTSEGWKILLSNQTDITKQISALNTFLKEKISSAQRSKLQYIDLRIQDRIYYK